MSDRLSKRGRIWYAWIPQPGGGLAWLSTRCTDKGAARVVQERLEREAVDPAYRAAHEATLDEILLDYRADRVRLGRAAETIKFIEKESAHLSRLLPQRLIEHSHVTSVAYVTARANEGARDTTIKKEIGVYRPALKLAKRNGKFRGDIEAILPEVEDDYVPRTRALHGGDELQRLITALSLPCTDMTHRQRMVLDYLRGEIENGRKVTLRSICKHFGWSSTNAATAHLHALERKCVIMIAKPPTALEGGPRKKTGANDTGVPQRRLRDHSAISLTGIMLEVGPVAPTPEKLNHVAVVLFTIAAGTRWAETMRAERSHIDIERGFVTVYGSKTARKTKGATAKVTIPMTDFTRPLFAQVLALTEGRRGRLFDTWGSVNRDLRIACEQAGIEKVSPNDLRRTFGNWLAGSGADHGLIGDMLRHTDGRMSKRVYGRKTPEQLSTVIRDRLTVGGVEDLVGEMRALETGSALVRRSSAGAVG